MKSRKGEKTLIIFHNRNNFELYGDDAQVAAEILGLSTIVVDDILTLQIVESNRQIATNKLLDAGHAIFISEMRDKNGNYITDIIQLEDE